MRATPGRSCRSEDWGDMGNLDAAADADAGESLTIDLESKSTHWSFLDLRQFARQMVRLGTRWNSATPEL